MRTIHAAIAVNEDTNTEAIEKAITILNKLFYTKEIEGYRVWLSTKEGIDTWRGKILEFLATEFPDFKDL